MNALTSGLGVKKSGLRVSRGFGFRALVFRAWGFEGSYHGGDRVLISEPSQLPVLFLGVPYYNYSIMGPTTLF